MLRAFGAWSLANPCPDIAPDRRFGMMSCFSYGLRPEPERAVAALPGTRVDEGGDGHGFGLAITTELAGL